MRGDQMWVIPNRAARVLNNSMRHEADESGQPARGLSHGQAGCREQPSATCLLQHGRSSTRQPPRLPTLRAESALHLRREIQASPGAPALRVYQTKPGRSQSNAQLSVKAAGLLCILVSSATVPTSKNPGEKCVPLMTPIHPKTNHRNYACCLMEGNIQ